MVYNQPVGRIVQLVRTPLLHRGGRRFESYSAHQKRHISLQKPVFQPVLRLKLPILQM
jgi:hypothetical protein